MRAQWLATAALAAATSFSLALTPERLRCEYLEDPIGVGTKSPRLSWILTSARNGELQSAYRIVASTNADGTGVVWDSGKIASTATNQIAYGGKPLRSRERVWWRVTVWDQQGRPTRSSQAFWETGLLSPSDWKAHWIGQLQSTEVDVASTGQWIWYPEAPANNTDRQFVKAFDIQPRRRLKRIRLGFAADNSYKVTFNGQPVLSGKDWADYGVVDVTKFARPGKNAISVTVHNIDGPAGFLCAGAIEYANGVTKIGSDGSWDTASDGKTWLPAKVLSKQASDVWGRPKWTRAPVPAPHVRTEFTVRPGVVSARAYVSAKGLYTLSIDGQRVGIDVLRPGWTDFGKRIQYKTYDVTRALKAGKHAVGMVLGNGWYAGHIASFGDQFYGPQPMGLAQIEIQYRDGSQQTVATDANWKVRTGPFLADDLLMGEDYDARLELPGWATCANQTGGWKSVLVKPLGKTPLVAQRSQSVQRLLQLHPKSISEPKPGVYVYDLGQNMVGWARLVVRGKAGQHVQMRFAEMLNPDGTIYTTNLRTAKATDTYTLKGGGLEYFEPLFTFHGFRYVEVTGYPGKPSASAITGVVAGSNTPRTGWFACSNPMVNQLASNILWGQRGNYLEVPTDCPQRDERLGWMGDAQVFVRTATYNNDIAAFMTKWTQDVEDTQTAEGGYADYSPRVRGNSGAAPAWGDAGLIVPWTIYQAYGDKQILRDRYASMQKWVQYIDEANPDHLWRNRVGANYGDWLSVDADLPRDVLATAYFAYDAHLMSQIAQVLGKPADQVRYSRLYQATCAAFTKEFVSSDGEIKGDTQTGSLLALRFGLVPQHLRAAIAKRLVDNIVGSRKGHLSTGFVGVGYLTPTLTDIGRSDVAYKLLTNDTYPSWGYSIRHGATTIWERWDGWTHDKGFQDPGMNSFNHYSLGSVGQWMFETVAGISHYEPGFSGIMIAPVPGGGLTWAKGTVDTIRGTVRTSWKVEGAKFVLDVTIPANTTAMVHLPAAATTVPHDATRIGAALFQVRGGEYRFESGLPKPSTR